MSTASDIAKAVVPPVTLNVGVGLPGEQIAAAAVEITNTVLKVENTPAMVQDTIEAHAQAAKDALQRAIATGNIEALRRMAAIMPVLTLFLVLLSGCMTVAPHLRTEGYPVYDASTPPQYPSNNSGLLDQVTMHGRKYDLITVNRAKGWADAVPCRDKYGNHVFEIPADEFAAKYNTVIDGEKAAAEAAK